MFSLLAASLVLLHSVTAEQPEQWSGSTYDGEQGRVTSLRKGDVEVKITSAFDTKAEAPGTKFLEITDTEHTLKAVLDIEESGSTVLVDCEVIPPVKGESVEESGEEVTGAELEKLMELHFLDMLSALRMCESLHVGESNVRPARRRRSTAFWTIYPGTKWCGHGSVAEHPEDYGRHMEADKCCKAHDSCAKTIPGFTTKYNLFNWGFHTLTECGCDDEFFSCLKAVPLISREIQFLGRLYFNMLQRQCFTLETKEVCTDKSWWGECLKKEITEVGTMRDGLKFE